MNWSYGLVFSLLPLLLSVHICSSEESFVPSKSEGLLAALGDFNNDKYIDLVAIDDPGEFPSLSIYYTTGRRNILFGKKMPSSLDKDDDELEVKSGIANAVVKAVIPGDFNGDNALDIAVLIGNTADSKVKVGIFFHGLDKSGDFLGIHMFNQTFIGQPLLLDHNGDQIPDFFGNVEVEDKTLVRLVTNYQSTSDIVELPKSDENEIDTLNPDFAHAFSHVVDDDQPDLVLAVDEGDGETRLQVWTGRFSQYTKKYTVDFPTHNSERLGQPTLVDVDLDGQMDMVLPVCEDADCAISKIYYRDMGKQVNSWHLMYSFANSSAKKDSDPFRFLHTSSYAGMSKGAMILRSGDIDFDGYPDFLVILKRNGESKRRLFLLYNRKCEDSSESLCDGDRTLVPLDLDVSDCEVATFFDYKENGENNIIYSKIRDNNKFRLGSDSVSEKGDSSFLKVMVIGGLCGSNLLSHEKCRFGEDVNYGANLPGPTLKYKTHGSSGHDQSAVATQMSQATHFALQTPFVTFGLGQIPNFVETLVVVLSSQKDGEFGKAKIENVIPNSQLILIPFPPDDPDKWYFQLLVYPSDILWEFATALFGLVIVLAFAILLLQYQEKLKDDDEKRQDAHKFHFDAM